MFYGICLHLFTWLAVFFTLLFCSSGDGTLLIVLVFNDTSFSTRLSINCSLDALKNEICEYWSQLTSKSIEISFVIEDRIKIVESDYDLQSIVLFQLHKKSAFFCFDVKLKEFLLENVIDGSSALSINVLIPSSSDQCLGANIVVHRKSYLKDLMKRGSTLKFTDFTVFCFGSAKEFREFLIAFQIKSGQEYHFLKNSVTRITAICSSFSTGCLFKVHASCDVGQLNRFFIRNLVVEHSCKGGLTNLSNPSL